VLNALSPSVCGLGHGCPIPLRYEARLSPV
jgi:hypothetical protein